MRKIKIKRPLEGFNKNCSYRIFIGNEKMIELRNGEERTVEINAKSEFLKGKIHWCGSKKIKLADEKIEEIFEIHGNKFLNRKFQILAVAFLFASSFAMNSKSEVLKNIGIVSLIILLAFVIAALTIGRNKWLNIRSINSNIRSKRIA
jgi:hypothetical protein